MNHSKLISAFVLGALIAVPVVGFSAESSTKKTGNYMDDTGVTTKVKAALAKEEGLKAFDISVETYNNKVQLCGFVDSQKTADMAAEKAKSVEGVQSIENNILVKK